VPDSAPRLVPLAPLISRRDAQIQDLISGQCSCFKVQEWERQYIIPALHSSREDAIKHVQAKHAEDRHGKQVPATRVISDYFLSEPYMDREALRYSAVLGSFGVCDMWVVSKDLPKEIRADILPILKEKILREREFAGDTHADTVNVGRYLLQRKWLASAVIPDIEEAAHKIAQKRWREQTAQSPPPQSIDLGDLNSGFSDLGMQDQNLQKALWDHPEVQLRKVAQMALKDRYEELSEQNAQEFAKLWRDRLSAKAELYHHSLNALEGSLKDQLADLLNGHITKELVPQTCKRANDRWLLRNERVSKLASKLANKLSTSKDLLSTLSSLSEFQQKLSMTPIDAAALDETSTSEVHAWYETFLKDNNDARRFICAVLILLAKKKNCTLYATAKFGPKLLKLVKDDIGSEAYGMMERMKDEVKAGKVHEETMGGVKEILGSVMGAV
jgi:hypothetical protein